MKTFATLILASILLVGCAVPKNPKISWGKKCAVQGQQVVWSYAWMYDKETGLDATKENCKIIFPESNLEFTKCIVHPENFSLAFKAL